MFNLTQSTQFTPITDVFEGKIIPAWKQVVRILLVVLQISITLLIGFGAGWVFAIEHPAHFEPVAVVEAQPKTTIQMLDEIIDFDWRDVDGNPLQVHVSFDRADQVKN